MALEAAKQIAIPGQTISGFRFTNVALKTVLIIPDTEEGIEVSISFKPHSFSRLKNTRQYYDFTIFSFNISENNWSEHCTGSVCVEYEAPFDPVDDGLASTEEKRASKALLDSFDLLCQTPLPTPEMYAAFFALGLQFGPCFRNLDKVSLGGGVGHAVGTITAPDIAALMPEGHLHPYLIQPAAMDSMMHILFAAVMDTAAHEKNKQAMLPTVLSEAWISASASYTPGTKFRCHGQARSLSTTKWEAQVSVWDAESGQPAVMVKGLQLMALGSPTVFSTSHIRSLCHNIEWGPATDLVTTTEPILKQFKSVLDEAYITSSLQKYQLAASLFIADILSEVGTGASLELEPHRVKYIEWLNHQNSLIENGSLSYYDEELWKAHKNDADLKKALFEEVKGLSAQGELLMQIGPQIASVLHGTADALDIMFREHNLMKRYYLETTLSGNIEPLLKEYLHAARHNHSNLRILEIGAGTGSATKVVLEGLQPLDPETQTPIGSAIGSYCFTDISKGFFGKAKESFEPWSKLLNFQTLNVEEDPTLQGFELGSFDIVVAANVSVPMLLMYTY
jgi:Polyketide synthase dehydratase/Methyltransferase domain